MKSEESAVVVFVRTCSEGVGGTLLRISALPFIEREVILTDCAHFCSQSNSTLDFFEMSQSCFPFHLDKEFDRELSSSDSPTMHLAHQHFTPILDSIFVLPCLYPVNSFDNE